MLRKLLIVSAIAVAAAAAIPTDASARGGRGGWHGGGWHGGGGHWHGGWRGGYRGWGWGPAVGLGFYAPYYGYNSYGCWRTVRVGTPYGWRWRRIWVC